MLEASPARIHYQHSHHKHHLIAGTMVHPDHRRPLHLAFEWHILTIGVPFTSLARDPFTSPLYRSKLIGVPFTSPSKSEALYPRHAVPPR
jgi:hypothetical protein